MSEKIIMKRNTYYIRSVQNMRKYITVDRIVIIVWIVVAVIDEIYKKYGFDDIHIHNCLCIVMALLAWTFIFSQIVYIIKFIKSKNKFGY